MSVFVHLSKNFVLVSISPETHIFSRDILIGVGMHLVSPSKSGKDTPMNKQMDNSSIIILALLCSASPMGRELCTPKG